MGNLSIDVEGLNSSVLPAVQQAKSSLNSAKSAINSISIPSDFSESSIITGATNDISGIISQIDSAKSSVTSSILRFLTAFRKNDNVISSLPEIFSDITLSSQGKLKAKQLMLKKIREILSRTRPGEDSVSIDSQGRKMYQDDTFLQTADNCWKKMYHNGNNIYYDASEIKLVPFNWSAENWNTEISGTTDCSSFITWALYEYGYDIRLYDKNAGDHAQQTTYSMIRCLNEWEEKYGWEVTHVDNSTQAIKQVKAGDIVLLNEHVFMVKEKKDNGQIVTFDAGDRYHWTEPGSEEGTHSKYFDIKDNRPAYIIRVEDISWEDVEFLNAHQLHE